MPLVRNLISLGTHSLVVALPADWIERRRLKRGGQVVVSVEVGDRLEIIPLEEWLRARKRTQGAAVGFDRSAAASAERVRRVRGDR